MIARRERVTACLVLWSLAGLSYTRDRKRTEDA